MKVECWQTYQELDANRSLAAFHAGDVDDAWRLLRREAEVDRPVYERLLSEGLDFARIRLVQFPLTQYLRYEILNYLIRHEMGETIEMVVLPAGVRLPGGELFDFLLFDEACALIHDYGDDGLQRGGWVTTTPEVLRALSATVRDLRSRAVPLGRFLESHPDCRSDDQPVTVDQTRSTAG